jgi:hypothetical protein
MKTALRSIWHKLAHIYIYLFNGAYRAQRRDPLTIPVIIINFNQLFYLKQLLSFLKERKFKNIVIIDNNSSFQPLLDYYEEIKSEITLYQMDDNYGHMVFFENPSLYAKYAKAYYIVTDADIVPNDHTPQNFVQMFMRWIDEDLYARKVGFALKLSDIPDYYPLKEKVLNWEKKFWNHQLDKNVFRADIDTTFALYRPMNQLYRRIGFYSGIRIGGNMEATHGGWYLNPNQLTEEEKFYRSTASLSSSWTVDDKGGLKGMHDQLYGDYETSSDKLKNQ